MRGRRWTVGDQKLMTKAERERLREHIDAHAYYWNGPVYEHADA